MQNKPWYLSKTIWGVAVTALAAIIPTVAKMNAEGLTGDLTQLASGVALVVGAALAIYGRYKAATKIGK